MPERYRGLFITGLLLLLAGLFVGLQGFYNDGRNAIMTVAETDAYMTLASPAFEEGAHIPERYSCKGLDISPGLKINAVPNQTKSLALVVHDPDAPSGDFIHWIAWEIPPTTSIIGEGSLPPSAISGSNGANKTGYMGPCPPAGTGTHHYYFELYALNTNLSLEANSDHQQLQAAMQGHILSQASLVGLFDAQK